MIKTIKKIVLLTCLVTMFYGCKSNDSPNPSGKVYQNSDVIGTWQLIKGRTYTQHSNGTITNETIDITNDTINHTECLAYEFTTNNMANAYTASFYEAWNKDTLIVTNDAFSYKIINNKLVFDNTDEWQIITLTGTNMFLKQYQGGGDVVEATYKKIDGNTFNDFVFIP